MFNLDPQSGRIAIPRGDTALFKVKIRGEALPEGSAAVFGVARAGSQGKFLLCKVFDVKENEVLVRLTNHDTRDLPVGTQQWDLRIVTDPDRNEAGEVRANDPGDNVYSIFSGSGSMPEFVVTGIAAEV